MLNIPGILDTAQVRNSQHLPTGGYEELLTTTPDRNPSYYKVLNAPASLSHNFLLNLKSTETSQILSLSFKSNRWVACIFYFLLFKEAIMIHFFPSFKRRTQGAS